MGDARVIVTAATGDHRQLVELAIPTFYRLAVVHGCDLVTVNSFDAERPPAWTKVALLRELLNRYDEVLWIDADCLVVRFDKFPSLPADAFQAFAPDGDYTGPNSGVWLVRSCDEASMFLDRVWQAKHFIHHNNWEQAAVKSFLGYSADPERDDGTPLREWAPGSAVLDREWNNMAVGRRARIQHYASRPLEQRLWQMKADLAAVDGRWNRERLRKDVVIPTKTRVARRIARQRNS